MESILEAFFNGRIRPCDYCTWSEPYRQAIHQFSAQYDPLRAQLKALDPALHQALTDCHAAQLQLSYLELQDMFCHGFRLGAGFMQEILAKD